MFTPWFIWMKSAPLYCAYADDSALILNVSIIKFTESKKKKRRKSLVWSDNERFEKLSAFTKKQIASKCDNNKCIQNSRETRHEYIRQMWFAIGTNLANASIYYRFIHTGSLFIICWFVWMNIYVYKYRSAAGKWEKN